MQVDFHPQHSVCKFTNNNRVLTHFFKNIFKTYRSYFIHALLFFFNSSKPFFLALLFFTNTMNHKD